MMHSPHCFVAIAAETLTETQWPFSFGFPTRRYPAKLIPLGVSCGFRVVLRNALLVQLDGHLLDDKGREDGTVA